MQGLRQRELVCWDRGPVRRGRPRTTALRQKSFRVLGIGLLFGGWSIDAKVSCPLITPVVLCTLFSRSGALGQEIFALSLPQTIRKGEKQLDLFGEFSMLEVKRKAALPSHGSASARPIDADPRTRPPQREEPSEFRGKLPVITGECHFKGSMAIDGLLTGQ